MNKFLKQVLIFIIPIIVILFPIDWILSNGLKNSSIVEGEIEVCNDIYSGNINTDIIVLGSSRVWVHIDPNIIEKITGLSTYCIGFDGSFFDLQYFMFREYLSKNKKPKFVIYSLDSHSFNKSKGTNMTKFAPFMLWNKDMIDFFKDFPGYKLADYYIPTLRYTGNTEAIKTAIYYYFTPSPSKYRDKGYKGLNLSWYTSFNGMQYSDVKKMINQSHPNRRELMIHLSSFDNFLKECKKENIQVLMLYTPEYCEDGALPLSLKETLEIYQQVKEENAIPFFDFSNDPLSSDTTYFYNYMHLNREGSQLFTNKLASRLNDYIIAHDIELN